MTPIYEVKTKHTKEMLEHFVTMTFEVKNPNVARHVAVLSLCWYLLAYIAREDMAFFIAFIVFGTVGFLFLLIRKRLGVESLKRQDQNYIKGGEVTMIFGQKGFVVESTAVEETKKLNYSEITALYKDKLFYFIGINNEAMQILYKKDLTGDCDSFEAFIEGKVEHKTFYEVNLPFVAENKRRWVRFKYDFQMKKYEAEEKQNVREAQIQENKRKKKQNKKK